MGTCLYFEPIPGLSNNIIIFATPLISVGFRTVPCGASTLSPLWRHGLPLRPLTAGFVIYFGYGISHSLENKPLSTYSHMISYSGSEPADSLAGAFDQTIHKPQPDIDQHPVIDEQPEGAESGEEQWAEPTRAARDDWRRRVAATQKCKRIIIITHSILRSN